jgi:hypothetical protein
VRETGGGKEKDQFHTPGPICAPQALIFILKLGVSIFAFILQLRKLKIETVNSFSKITQPTVIGKQEVVPRPVYF